MNNVSPCSIRTLLKASTELVFSKINGHKATIAEDYQDLKEIVMEKRREEMLQKWILDKQKHTYVRINENWQKCDFKYPGWIKKD